MGVSRVTPIGITKECPRCERQLLHTAKDFYRNNGGLSIYCKPCAREMTYCSREKRYAKEKRSFGRVSTQHKQKRTTCRGKTLYVDEGMKRILEKLWMVGIYTTCSCQGGDGEPAYISFENTRHAQRIFGNMSQGDIPFDMRLTLGLTHSAQLEFPSSELDYFYRLLDGINA
jgi:hypothetical protein